MAKQSDARAHSRHASAFVVPRFPSHVFMEGLLLLSALGLLCIMFGFFFLQLRSIAEDVFATAASVPSTSAVTTPPRVETRVTDTQLSIVAVDDTGTITNTFYSSDLSDDIADFTLFAVPQTGYQGLVYVRPILDGNLPNLKVYPLDTTTGTLKAATLNVPVDDFALSSDQTVVGIRSENTLALYAVEDGTRIAESEIPSDWLSLAQNDKATLTLSGSSCLSLTSSLAPADIQPAPLLCP